jgi:hypothetical protein
VVLDEELDSYKRELPNMLAAHSGEYALIHGQHVLGFWPTRVEAYAAGVERVGLGPFLVKKVEAVEPVFDLYVGLNLPCESISRLPHDGRAEVSADLNVTPGPSQHRIVRDGRGRKVLGRPVLLRAMALVASCAGLLIGAPAAIRYFDPFEARPFDPAAWAAADTYGRAAMARDAIRHLPPGTPEAEVERLLGPGRVEDSKRLTGSAPGAAIRTYCYHLGGGWAFYYDSTFLWVHVGADGRVIEAVIGGG